MNHILLQKVARYTAQSKHLMNDIDYSFFVWKDDKGFKTNDDYAQIYDRFPWIDMRYNAFDWQQGVGFYGLVCAANVLQDENLFQAVRHWVDERLMEGLPSKNVNTTVPFLCMLALHKRYHIPKYESLCAKHADFLMTQAKRTVDGGFEHTVIGINQVFHRQIWADTMFMTGVYLALWGKHINNDMYQHEACRQLLVHYRHLRDSETGLLFHAYDGTNKSHLSGIHWGRANGWGVLSCAIVANALNNSMAKEKNWVLTVLSNHLSALFAVQQPNGGFANVLDQPQSKTETSVACAVFAACNIAKNHLHFLQSKKIQALAKHLKGSVDEQGFVSNASCGTPVMTTATQYEGITRGASYCAQGLMLLALIEDDLFAFNLENTRKSCN